jgi:hypothetical protein
MTDFSNKLRAMLGPDIYADLTRGTQWSRPGSGALSEKMDDAHANMRLGMLGKSLKDWLEKHPHATDEQLKASARRYAAMIGSNPSFFKRVRLGISLSKRTDLQTSL